MNPDSGLCVGCLRTLEEICQWSRASPGSKRDTWGLIALRAKADRRDDTPDTAP